MERFGAMTTTVDIRRIVESPATKIGLATRMVPLGDISGVVPMDRAPRVGDLVLAEVVRVGKNKRLEVREGYAMDLFAGDYVIGSFGNRYATGQFEGYVPDGPVEECDLYSGGGVCGEVASSHASMAAPTRIRILGYVTDPDGEVINQCAYRLPDAELEDGLGGGPEVILVVGSSMDSGKTNTVGMISHALSRAGYSVAAAKVTGTATGKDARFFASCGANPAFDFIEAGYPSTYMIEPGELMGVYRTLLGNLMAGDPDYIVLEIADGIFQRETRMLLDSNIVREGVDHVFFAAGDALAAAFGAQTIERMGLPLRATSGLVSAGQLGMREAEDAAGIPCLSNERMMAGELLNILHGVESGAIEGVCGVRGLDLKVSA